MAYTDLHYVMEMFAASDVSKEDVLKIAEGIALQPATDDETQGIVCASDWSAFMKSQEEGENITASVSNLSVPKSALKTFSIRGGICGTSD